MTTRKPPKTPAKPKATPAGRKRASKPKAQDAAATKVRKSAASNPVPLHAVPTPAPADESAKAPDTRIKRPDLLDRVAKRAALKRSEVKDVMDLLFEELGATLDAHDEAVLPPLGKLSVKKRVQGGAASTLTVKLRRPAPKSPAS